MTKLFDENEKRALLKDLDEFGLKGHAATLYCALLGKKEIGITALENTTGLHRQIIYNALHTLEELGLAKHSIINGRRRFSAQPPRRIQSLIDDKQRLAQNLIERLSLLTVPKTMQEFEVFQGQSAFIAHEMQTLLDAEEGETLSLIAGNWDKFYRIMAHKIDAYEKLRAARKIHIRFIGTQAQQTLLQEAKTKRPLFEYRFLPGLANGLMDISIWSSSISLNFFGDPVVAFVLKNKEVAQSQQIFFDSLWAIGKE